MRTVEVLVEIVGAVARALWGDRAFWLMPGPRSGTAP